MDAYNKRLYYLKNCSQRPLIFENPTGGYLKHNCLRFPQTILSSTIKLEMISQLHKLESLDWILD